MGLGIVKIYVSFLFWKKQLQVIRRNQVYFSSPNVSTETTVIVKD